MNATCERLRDALDAGADCRFALVDALLEDGDPVLADLYRTPQIQYKPTFAEVRLQFTDLIYSSFGIPQELINGPDEALQQWQEIERDRLHRTIIAMDLFKEQAT